MEEAIPKKPWKELIVSGDLWVSDFGRMHCTEDFTVVVKREEAEPGMYVKTPANFNGARIIDFDDYKMTISLGGEQKELRTGEKVDGPNCPLSYAWSTIGAYLKGEDDQKN